MHFLEDLCGLQDIIIVLFALDDHEDASGVLHLQEYFLGSHIADCLDKLGTMWFGGIIDPGHRQLNHLDLSFLALSASVHQEVYHLVQFVPVLGLVA